MKVDRERLMGDEEDDVGNGEVEVEIAGQGLLEVESGKVAEHGGDEHQCQDAEAKCLPVSRFSPILLQMISLHLSGLLSLRRTALPLGFHHVADLHHVHTSALSFGLPRVRLE
jgi:hypothetical protein